MAVAKGQLKMLRGPQTVDLSNNALSDGPHLIHTTAKGNLVTAVIRHGKMVDLRMTDPTGKPFATAFDLKKGPSSGPRPIDKTKFCFFCVDVGLPDGPRKRVCFQVPCSEEHNFELNTMH